MSNMKIEKFIASWREHPGAIQMFTEGKCFWFAAILAEAFPGGVICYDAIVGHFYYFFKEKYWDIRGAHTDVKTYSWPSIIEKDWPWAKRIMRDCVFFEEVQE